MYYSDTGRPMQRHEVATPEVGSIVFDDETRQLSIRNTGVNTLWFTFEDPTKQYVVVDEETGKAIGTRDAVWFDLACGTSWDDRIITKHMRFRTQTGVTTFIAMGVRLHTLPAGA